MRTSGPNKQVVNQVVIARYIDKYCRIQTNQNIQGFRKHYETQLNITLRMVDEALDAIDLEVKVEIQGSRPSHNNKICSCIKL